MLYFGIFFILTYPLLSRFTTHFFADTGDGLQNVWNIWWVIKAITALRTSPWFTYYLHYPGGTSLLGHTLNPFNGFVGILLRPLSLIEIHNVVVIFSFVAGGLTAFWLALSITDSYFGSLFAGFIFTFSQYHFAHAEGHLNLVSLEWIPLFVLCWYRLVSRPSPLSAVISALVLFAVLLCDYYYFFYCVLAAVVIVFWHAIAIEKNLFFFLKDKKYLGAFSIFAAGALLTSGTLVGCLLMLQIKDPLLGAHSPLDYSLDLLAPFIPGGHWRFSQLTEPYWSRLPGNIHESSVYVGFSVILIICYCWFRRKDLYPGCPSFYLWYGLMLFFFVMALGPRLHLGGRPLFYTLPMPYSVFGKLFPLLRLSSNPVRMMVMVMLAASVISAMGLKVFFQTSSPLKMITFGIWCLLLFFDFLPKEMPSSKIEIPEYVKLLKQAPENGAVFDKVSKGGLALYYQTVHQKPLTDGYISRYPASVDMEDEKKSQDFKLKSYEDLSRQYGVRFLITSYQEAMRHSEWLTVLYRGGGVVLYRIDDKNREKR
jgi:hypothetical protein